MSIRFLVTGGTFDKRYDELKGELSFSESHLPEILKQSRMTLPTALEITRMVDSLDMTDDDRRAIVTACAAAAEDRIVIVHGTDTMTVTGRWLGEAGFAKTIVLTGAMVPYAFTGSDSLFNLGFAVAAVQLLDPGVYIAMNGRVFAWDAVRKNGERGVFESVEAMSDRTGSESW